jgi:hypothetical protein
VDRWGDDPVAALPEVLRMAVSQVGIVGSTPSALSARTYSASVLALPSQAWRSLISSMINMKDAAFDTNHRALLLEPCPRGVRARE